MTHTKIRKTLISAAVTAATLSAGQLSAAQIEEIIVDTKTPAVTAGCAYFGFRIQRQLY